MVIPAPIFRQLIMIDPDFSLGKIKVYLDAPALTSCPGHLRDGNGLRGTGQYLIRDRAPINFPVDITYKRGNNKDKNDQGY